MLSNGQHSRVRFSQVLMRSCIGLLFCLLASGQKYHERIVIGTVQTLTLQEGSDHQFSTDSLSGLRFWVDHTNEGGGMRLQGRTVPVELVYFNDMGSSRLALKHYQKLVMEKQVDFLFAGGAVEAESLLSIANSSNTVIMVPDKMNWLPDTHPLMFHLHKGLEVSFPLDDMTGFLARMADGFQIKRLLFYSHTESESGRELCTYAMEIAFQSGLFEVSSINQTSPELWGEHIARNQPEVLLACTTSSSEATALMTNMVNNGLLYGWHTDEHYMYNPTVVESPTSLIAACFIDGAADSGFLMHKQGWVDKIMGAVFWAPALNYKDAYFNNSMAANELWKGRGDFGNGYDMHPDAAAAVGAGAALRLAIEAAESLEAEAVAAALRNLDTVRFDEGGHNVGHKAAMVQWQCDHSKREGKPCVQHIVHPESRQTAWAQAWTKACDRGSLRTALLDRFDSEPATPWAEEAAAVSDGDSGVEECTRCVDAVPQQIEDLALAGDSNQLLLKDACEVFREVVSVGSLFSQHDDAVTIEALKFAKEMISSSLSILPNVPLELYSIESSLIEQGNHTEIEHSLQTVVAEVYQHSPRTGYIWSSGQAAIIKECAPHLGQEVAALGQTRRHESQTMFTWHTTSVSLVPPPRAQAKGLVRLVEHFGWNRARLVQGAEAAFADMGQLFADEALEVGLTVFDRVLLPPEGDEQRAGVLKALQDMNHCEGRVLVLCVGATDAEAVFASVRDEEGDGRWTGKWVFLTSEEAAHAANKPPGLLTLRSVASDDSKKFADLSLHLQSLELDSSVSIGGSGVVVEAVVGPEDGEVVEVADKDAVVESGGELVEDRAYFAYDAFIAMCQAVWKMLQDGADLQSPEALRDALQSVEFDGASGTVKFDEQMQRTHGRYALVNWDGVHWHSLAYWDLEGSGVIIHTKQPGLRQSRWEEEAVAWPQADGTAASGRKPLDVCDCVLFTSIPEVSFDLRLCRWSIEGVVSATVTVLGLLSCVACCILRCCRRAKKLDVEEEQLLFEIEKLRARLHITRKDGFILSSEPQTMRLPWMREPRVLQRSHLEAVARLSMLAEFDVRGFDAFASCFYSGESAFESEKKGIDIWKSYSKMNSPRGDRPYVELRRMLLDISRTLLQPSAPHGRNKSSDAGSSQGSQRASSRGASRSNRSWSMWPQSRSSEQRERVIPRTAEERFTYFLHYVSKVQMWMEDDHRLFQTLQYTVVQELMDVLHGKCDDLFKKLKNEEGGTALAAFQWPWPSTPGDLRLLSTISPLQGAGPSDDDSCNPGDAPCRPLADDAQREEDAVTDVESILGGGPPSLLRHTSIDVASVSVAKIPDPSLEPSPALSPATRPAPAAAPPSLDLEVARFNYASITRQDHPAVRAIRLDEEDLREVAMQRANPAVGIAEINTSSSVEVLDEDLYITALRRRALLLNEEFQNRVRTAVELRFGAQPVDVIVEHTVEEEESSKTGGRRRSGQHQHSQVQHAVHVVERVHSAPVKTKARMKEKLVSYAAPTSSPLQRASDERPRGPLKDACEHPLTANILDPIRCTVVCRGAKEILEHVHWLIQDGESLGLPVVRVKNKFAMENSDEYDGYRDLMLCVLFTGETGLRIVCEIQIHDVRLHELKLQMHKLYKVKRATAAACI